MSIYKKLLEVQKEIKGLYIQFNNLETLEYCPEIIKTDFDCSNNAITTLEWCPSKINNFIIYRNITLKLYESK